MTPIPGPILLLGLPLAASAIAYLVRRWALLAALVSFLTSSVLAILCARLPLDRSAFVLGQEVAFGRPVVVVGRNLALHPAGQMWLAFVFATAAGFYLLAWRTSQGRSFFPFSLSILGLYALVALLETLSLAVIVFAISTTLAVFIIHGGQAQAVRGAQRYLLVALLAVPLLLTAIWMVENGQPEGVVINLTQQALLPAALGFGLLLAAFPFGTWMPAVAADAPPVAAAFVFTTGQTMALFLAVTFLRGTPGALDAPSTHTLLRFAGLLMVSSGGIIAAVQNDMGRLFGYAALSDLGYLLLAMGLGSNLGLTLSLLHMTNRTVAITLIAAALSIVRQHAKSDQFSDLAAVGQRLPIATAGLALGLLAMAGFPLTAGFPTHWATSRATWSWAQQAPAGQEWAGILTLIALLSSTIGISVGVLRGLRALRGSSQEDAGALQPRIASWLVLALIAFTLILSLHPQLFLSPTQDIVQALGLF